MNRHARGSGALREAQFAMPVRYAMAIEPCTPHPTAATQFRIRRARRRSMAYEAIRVINDSTSRVVTITLNRPDKLNSFTRAMHQEVAAALAEAQTSGARALVLTGAGRGFCAGQDLADLDFTPGAMSDLGTQVETYFNPLVRRL